MLNEYENIIDTEEKYEGESISKAIEKDSGEIWAANETGYYEMFSANGKTISGGQLALSGDSLHLYFSVPKADTIGLDGEYLLLVHLTDSVDTTVDDIIAEYSVTYKPKQATPKA